MKTQQGFTVIELMICIVIVLIICTISFNIYNGSRNGFGNVSVGINGMTESRCIDGYKFILGHRGNAQQVIGANGGGVQCEGVK